VSLAAYPVAGIRGDGVELAQASAEVGDATLARIALLEA